MIRIIGDTHGHVSYDTRLKNPQCNNIGCLGRYYLQLIDGIEGSIQLGDHGFDCSHLYTVNPQDNVILLGNHDRYDLRHDFPHFLQDFGSFTFGKSKCFYVRGALSVDKQWRIPHVSWWPEEELSFVESEKCVIEYESIKPDIVFSHDCPNVCYEHGVATNPNKISRGNTKNLLQECFNIYNPKYWFHCHHHKNWVKTIGSTIFVCLNELCYFDVDEEWLLESHTEEEVFATIR